jgi:predicted proteasome-type protease
MAPAQTYQATPYTIQIQERKYGKPWNIRCAKIAAGKITSTPV